MPGQPITEEQKLKKREREIEQQNSMPVIAQTWWKKSLHKFFCKPFVIFPDALFQVDEYF